MTGFNEYDIIKVKYTSPSRAEMKTLIKEYRKRYGLTQQQLADRVYVTKRTIISIEKGYYNPSIMLAYRIAEVFNSSIEELCCLKENKHEEDEAYHVP